MAITTLDQVKIFLQITDDDRDTLIEELIPQVEADYLIIRNAPFDEDSNGIIYPDNSELVVAQMIGFQMSAAMATGGMMKSESIGSYSYTLNSGASGDLGYPKTLTARIKRYVSSR